MDRVVYRNALVFAAHELREKTDEWNEPGQRRRHFFVYAVHFKTLIVEDEPSAVGGRHAVDPQRQIAFVALRARRTCENKHAGTGRAGGSDHLSIHQNRFEQYEGEWLAGFAFVRRKRRREAKSHVRSGGHLSKRGRRVGDGDRRRNQSDSDERAKRA